MAEFLTPSRSPAQSAEQERGNAAGVGSFITPLPIKVVDVGGCGGALPAPPDLATRPSLMQSPELPEHQWSSWEGLSMQGSPDTSMSGTQHGVQEHGHFSKLELASAGHTNLFNPSRQVYVDHLRPLPGTRPPAPCQAEQAQLARQSAQHEPTASVDYEMQACRRQIDANLDEIQRLQRALSDAGIEQPGGSANGYACEVSGMTQGGMTISQAAAPPQAGFARRPLQLGAQQYPREVQQSPMRPPDWWETHWQVRRRGTANLESPTQPKPKTQP